MYLLETNIQRYRFFRNGYITPFYVRDAHKFLFIGCITLFNHYACKNNTNNNVWIIEHASVCSHTGSSLDFSFNLEFPNLLLLRSWYVYKLTQHLLCARKTRSHIRYIQLWFELFLYFLEHFYVPSNHNEIHWIFPRL